jgi:hypothetical protein
VFDDPLPGFGLGVPVVSTGEVVLVAGTVVGLDDTVELVVGGVVVAFTGVVETGEEEVVKLPPVG